MRSTAHSEVQQAKVRLRDEYDALHVSTSDCVIVVGRRVLLVSWSLWSLSSVGGRIAWLADPVEPAVKSLSDVQRGRSQLRKETSLHATLLHQPRPANKGDNGGQRREDAWTHETSASHVVLQMCLMDACTIAIAPPNADGRVQQRGLRHKANDNHVKIQVCTSTISASTDAT